jgi:ABC-type transport system substrate-binding protein
MRWCNQEFDELHERGLVTLDQDERDDIYVEMQQLWDEACHTVWITHGVFIYAHPESVKPATTPHGRPQAELFQPA